MWDNTIRFVKTINLMVDPIEFTNGRTYCNIRLEDIDLGTESIGGDVKLEYTTTLK